jgi:hypothetical protein
MYKRKMRLKSHLRKLDTVNSVSTYVPPNPPLPYSRPPRYYPIKRRELARALGVGIGYVSAMKKAGYHPPEPTWYTIDTAERWLSEHPNFRTHKAYPSKDRKKRKQQ